jgi:GTP-sensing pleiotropic transcriptional regulator CodY
MSDTNHPGGRKPRVTDDELLETIDDILGEVDAPVVTTSQITEQVPLTQRAVRKRLRRLADEGAIGSVDVGNASVWWTTPT